jgi:hypothetical protein
VPGKVSCHYFDEALVAKDIDTRCQELLQTPDENEQNKSFCGVQGRFFQKEPLAAGG